MRVEREIDIGAPPDAVYDVLMDPSCVDRWVTIHDGWKEQPDGDLREGSELTQRLRIAGRRFDVRWQVVEAARPSRVVWEGRGPVHSHARVVYELSPNGDGTRFRYLNEYDLPGGPFGKAVGRAIRGRSAREADRSLERLKSLVEGG